MGFLANADSGVVAALDRRYAAVNAAITNVVQGVTGKYKTVEETYAALVVAFPEDMTEYAARDWLCVALTRLAHLEVEQVQKSEEEI